LLESLHDLSKVGSGSGLQISTIANELRETIVQSVVGPELLSRLNLGPDFAWLKSIEGYHALERLPQERTEGKHINLFVVGTFLEKFRGHVAWRTCKLHRSCI